MAIIACDTITLTDMTDVSKCTPYFKSQSAQSAAPDKPNAVPPTGWNTTEPGYDASKVVYICWLTEYSNGTFDYSDVSLMSSYTGAIEAWNKADNAQNAINNLEIGGRNILRNTADFIPEWALGSGASFSNGVATLTGSSSNYYSVIHSPKYDADEIYNGDTYVLSFEYKCDIACTVQTVIAASSAAITNLSSWTRTKYTNWISGTQPTLPATSGTWVKYIFNARSISKSDLTSGSGDIITGFIQIYARTNNANIQIRHIKLEKGNLATEWTPAPEDALAEEQTIYISKASGTNTVSENTTWVTVSSDSQNTWTTKRPTYNSSYPVLFIAKQSKTVGGRISCTTPLKDDTTTIIDGGHIITGTIDATAIISNTITANQIATGAIKADELDANAVTAAKIASNAVTADKIAAGAITIGKIDSTDTSTASAILNSEIEVGGRNLLAFNSPDCYIYGLTTKGIAAWMEEDGWIRVKGTVTGSTYGHVRLWGLVNDTDQLFQAGTYTLTCEDDGVLGPDTGSNICVQFRYKNDSLASSYFYGSDKVTLEITNFISRICLYIQAGATGKVVDGRIRFKLERGNVSTAWTPALADTENFGGVNMLPDSNHNAYDAVACSESRYISDTGEASYATAEFVNISDPPVPGIKYGYRLTCSQAHSGSTAARGLAWRDNDTTISIEQGETYTLSCYARKVSGDPIVVLRFGYNTGSAYTYPRSDEITLTSTDWTKLSYTFTFPKDGLNHTSGKYPLFYPINIRVHSVGVAEACGFKLEKGVVATDWTAAPADISVSIKNNSTEYIVGTQTAITGSWTGVTKDSSLYVGKTIAYKLPYAGSGNASLTLTLSDGTTTSAIAVYSMTTRVTTHYPSGSIIQMTYDGTYWRTTGWYNTNNYDRVLHNTYVLAVGNVTSGALVCGTAGGYKQVAASIPFDLSYPILWAGGAWTSNTQYANAYESYPGVNPATTGTVQSIAVNKMVYLKGTVVGNTFTCAVNNFLTCVVPSTADGFYYIPVGVVANDSTSKMYFSSSKELYAYVDGYFGVVSIREASAAAKKATNYITDITNSGIFVHTVDSPTPTVPLTTGNYGVHINGTDIGIIRNGVNVASYGDTIRVGKTSNHHIVLDSTGMAVVKNGLEFARFSDTIKLGRQNYSAQAEFGSSGLVFKNLQNEEIATIRANANPLDPTSASLTGRSYPESVFAITSSTATALAYTKLELYNIVFESPYTVDTKLDYTGFAIVSTEDNMTNPSEVWYHIKNSANSDIFTVTDLSTIDSSYTGTRTDIHCDYGSIMLSAPSTSRTITKTGILVKNEIVNGVRTETEIGNVSLSISVVFESANNNIKFGMSITGLPADIYEGDYAVKKHCTDKGDGIGYVTVTCRYTKVSGYDPEYVFGLKTANQDYQSYAFMTGRDVYANASEQFITGRFNDPDGTHAFEIGNGTDSANRSNAFSVGWDGNVDCNSLTSPSLSTQNLTASAGSLAGINMTRFFYPVSYSSFTSCAALPQNSVIRIPSAAAAAKYSDLPEGQAQVIMTFGTTDNSSGADNNRCVQVSIRNSLSMWVRGHGAGTTWGAWREVALQVPTSESGHWKTPSVVSSSCTIRNGGYYVEGKHVYVQLEIRVSSTLAANTNLDVLTGFPGPPFRILLPANTSGAYGNADISAGGAMRIRLSAQTGTSTSILIVGSYAIST